MMKHFFSWYYHEGLPGIFSLVKTYVRYVLFRYNIGPLFATLLTPWKRDVSYRTWRGFHPLKSLGALSENIFSRFWGMIARFGVIVTGMGMLGAVIISSCLFAVVYVLAGPLLLAGVGWMLFNPVLGAGCLMLGTVGTVGAVFGYMLRPIDPILSPDITVLRKNIWFPRFIARLGLQEEALPAEVFENNASFVAVLTRLGIEPETAERALAIEAAAFERSEQDRCFWRWEHLRKRVPIGKDWHYAYTPHLDRYALDLSRSDRTEYRNIRLVGRREELKVGMLVLERPSENSFLLVGDAGIGKKTFIHHLGRLIRENRLSGTMLNDARILLFDMGEAVSDAISRSRDIDQHIRMLFTEATYAGNVVLVLENIDLYLGVDPERPNLAPLFAEFLAYPTFRVIGTATPNQYHHLVKVDEQALKFFETIYLRETDPQETLEVLLDHFSLLEKQRAIFTFSGLKSIIESAERFNWEVPFPERAIDLAQQVLLYFRDRSEPFITPETVSAFVTLKTGVPTGTIAADEKEKLLQLETRLHERIVGQEEAVRQVAEAMRKTRAGFANSKRPLGSFLFLGPTGVGKTETVKAFAESYFGSEDKMIRLDMSEYQNENAVTRLIGSRESGMQGMLTNAAGEHPYSILLLDEVEKAYPRALDLFLQILDEGYVTDGFGEKINFRNMIIIATSNAGAPLIKEEVAKGTPLMDIRKRVLDEVVKTNVFRLEFLNRFDGVIFFAPLRDDELRQVTALQLEKFSERLKKEKNIAIVFSPEVIDAIVTRGYEPEFGARSINRYIQDTIEDRVAKKIISGDVISGGTFSISADDV